MGWIKRNLFFVIGGIIALILLGGSGFYIFQGWSRNAAAAEKLNDIYHTIDSLSGQNPSPGNEQVNNTDIARDQDKQIRDWVNSAAGYFQPVPAIPADPVTSESFAAALRRTVAQLQNEAESASVALPPQYDFSFAAQRPLMQFASGSLPMLSVQLGEIKRISEIIFSARVNALDGIQRARVSDDDISGPQGDYTAKQSVTNDLTIITPYVITFRSFTPEIAQVISAFATSSNAFIIKSVNVQPAAAAMAGDESQPGQPGMMQPGMNPDGYPPRRYGYPNGYAPPGAVPPAAQPSGKGGLQTILKEQLLQVTLEIDLVKLLPKS